MPPHGDGLAGLKRHRICGPRCSRFISQMPAVARATYYAHHLVGSSNPTSPRADLALGAWGLLLVGLVLWLFGVGIAHFLAVIMMGAAGAAAAVWGVPRMGWDFSPLTSVVAGFVIGAAIGALTFRVMQAILLAASLGIAVAGVYYGWHVMPVMPVACSADAFSGMRFPQPR